MLLKSKINELKKTIGKENILTGDEECYCYAVDASNNPNSPQTPDAVVFVKNIDDIVNVMKFAYKNNIPVVSRGAGTNMVGACVCSGGEIVLNFSKMNRIINLSTADMTVTVESGVVLGDLKKAVEDVGLFFPPDPSNYLVSTIGGAIAQSSGGAMSFKYGTTKDYVLSLKVVTSDGRIMTLGANTIKDSAGYHLAQLMVGSEGTLAIIAEATLKLIPKPENISSLSAYFDSIDDSMNAVNAIINSKIFPSAIDFMDNNSIRAVEDYAKCGLDTTKECLVLISLDGYTDALSRQTEDIVEILKSANASDIKFSDSDDIWKARRTSYASAARLAPDVITDDIIIPRSKISVMVKKCLEIAKKYDLKMCLVGHIGDGNIHPQIALNAEDENEFRRFSEAKAEMYQTAMELGGTLSAEHGIGADKKAFLQKFADESAIEYMKMIKQVFDPKNILNPNKIF